MYDILEGWGLEYREPFTGVVNVLARPSEALGIIRIPDTKTDMPHRFEHGHVLHPATLDACSQVGYPALFYEEIANTLMMPTFIRDLWLSADFPQEPGTEFLVHSSANFPEPRTCRGDILVAKNGPIESSVPLIEISGWTSTSVQDNDHSEPDSAKARQTSSQMRWAPDPDFLKPEDNETFGAAEADEIEIAARRLSCYQNVSAYFIRKALRNTEAAETPAMKAHHRRLLAWLQNYVAETDDFSNSMRAPEEILEQAKGFGADGQMLCRIGDLLGPILRGEIEPLSVMMEDKLLYDFYGSPGLERCHSRMAKYAEMLGYKNPNLKILEIGPGTGNATIPLLSALGSRDMGCRRSRRFQHLDFTDISSGFFEEAESRLGPWKDLIDFRKLDIEDDVERQGFELGAYDVIVASNVLHATRPIDKTLGNVRKLLKGEGKLLVVENTQAAAYRNLIFGTLPGWWLGTS